MKHLRTPAHFGLAATAALALGLAMPAAAAPTPTSAAEVGTSVDGGPSGGRIAFSSDCQVFTINPDGTALHQVTSYRDRCADFPAWSPDGTRLVMHVFASDFSRADLYTMTEDGTDARRVFSDDPGYFDTSPDFTSDGAHIVFSRCRPDPPGGCAIYSVGTDGSDLHSVTRYRSGIRAGTDTRPQVSPDGAWLTFSRFQSTGIQSQVWLMPMDGSSPARAITPVRLAGRSAKWAPDSRSVDFAAGSPTGYGFHVFQTSTTAPPRRTQLTFTSWPNGDISPAPSPDGRMVAFISDRRYDDACCNELFVMHADGSHQHLLTGDLLAGVPDWGTAPVRQGPSEPIAPGTRAMHVRATRAQALMDRLDHPAGALPQVGALIP